MLHLHGTEAARAFAISWCAIMLAISAPTKSCILLALSCRPIIPANIFTGGAEMAAPRASLPELQVTTVTIFVVCTLVANCVCIIDCIPRCDALLIIAICCRSGWWLSGCFRRRTQCCGRLRLRDVESWPSANTTCSWTIRSKAQFIAP